jgi:CHAT domain-containing protein
VPLDCLPTDKKGRQFVGELCHVILRPHLGPRTNPRVVATGGLLAMGGIDYGEPPTPLPPLPEGVERSRSSDPSQVGRWGKLTVFSMLPGSKREVEAVAEVYKQLLKLDPSPYYGADASTEQFWRSAERSRFLHIASHGFFIPDVVHGDSPETAAKALLLQDQVHVLAPMTLCGLAFAGANLGVDEHGRTSGLLTAEELATYDLGATDLAVLSACDTNAGLRTSGLGIQSLQTALHCAGVRRAITTLWPVTDTENLQKLMEQFYKRLWNQKVKVTAEEALWEAKMKMFQASVKPSDWMGFVLSSDSW